MQAHTTWLEKEIETKSNDFQRMNLETSSQVRFGREKSRDNNLLPKNKDFRASTAIYAEDGRLSKTGGESGSDESEKSRTGGVLRPASFNSLGVKRSRNCLPESRRLKKSSVTVWRRRVNCRFGKKTTVFIQQSLLFLQAELESKNRLVNMLRNNSNDANARVIELSSTVEQLKERLAADHKAHAGCPFFQREF